ncbi:hypothetical protein LTR36_003217 [Oleoguttula mirabilis]|uniref:Histone deacetylase interacting domain-containing protein n=1 Tax=Oleoguttula mirabilis TaxID=1507867 RepID=A0AAV9JWW9_9PEZI|nr:hypothetical protein LTR36_003217 [Oleoguttula mirabilis]
MDPAHRGWGPPAPGGNAHASNAEQGQSQAPRPGASYGTPQHQTAQSPSLGSSGLPPPPNPPFSFHQPAHGLASLAGVSQASPRQPPSTHRTDGLQSQIQQPLGFPLPGVTQATGQPGAADRERERAREIEQHIHIKEEEDRRHRDQERQRLEQVPQHQPHSGPPLLHQPVAVGPRSVHGPNGLLGNPSIAGPQHAQMPLGAPSGPGNIFAGGPVQPAQTQSGQQQQLQANMLMPFPGAQQAAQQQVVQGPGQQPILNDALSYLDQVKVQFADHPDVYNRFLDIMKDFKSGAIDTPGVIGRVSTLFAGNPELIQGFNTFLPPGYRIECGTTDDPNAIRVTTPMGTTIQNMHQPRPVSRQEDGLRPANGTFTPQPGAQSAQMMFSPSGRPVGPAAPGQQQHLSPLETARQQEQLAMHVQEQRGVNSLQSAVSAAASGGGLRAGISPRATPLPGQDVIGLVADPAAMEKRGPVEFNHAISYVNKIKNRFSAQPDIYKQFLEILQTYQRESKPIQDVYSQVTRLFGGAPDLLLDFKQFLPESAAQAKAAEMARQQAEESAMLSNVRGEMYGSPVMSRETHMGTPNHGRGLPPVGNFAPTPISKDNKKRKNERQDTADSMAGPSGSKVPFSTQPAGKRQKQTHPPAKGVSDQAPISPGLVPALPTAMAPTTSAATSEELSFFDRAKKAISNKNTMNEFLKLCNLFSQDLIDGTTLMYRAKAFIGGNAELMNWFQQFVGYDERDIIIENKARMPTGRVSLSNCRGLGPSYRLLPKRERQKPCSGRDELCNAVLNDEWASHPTWASEDSGFIAHKKNQNEEGLHRIEEERHDYDYNVEACSRTIQLLEPIAQQLRRLPDAEQKDYKLPPGLGGQSETIYKRIIMKIYGREKGHDVIEQLHMTPYQVIPVLLNRLKERLESWKMAQREWEKVWRDQTQKMFWRSLDHQAMNNTKADKKQFLNKTLQTEIAVRREEMRRQELVIRGTMRKPQLEFLADDLEVVVDAASLLVQYVKLNMEADHPKLRGFVKEFVPLFFGLDAEAFNAQIEERTGNMTPIEFTDEPVSGAEDAGVPRVRKGNAKTGNLLRTALDRGRNGKLGRKDREDSNASASRASTPEVASNAGDPEDMAIDAAEDTAESKIEQPEHRWFEHPDMGNALGGRNIDPNEPQKRDAYPLWANTNLYCFIRMFFMLYDRLRKLKLWEEKAAKTVENAMKAKPAVHLGINDKLPSEFFTDVSGTANYYKQMLAKFDDVLKGDLEFVPEVEETLRRFYLQSGYPLYAFEKLIGQTAKYAAAVLNGEGKEKSWDIYQLFRKDRMKDTATHMQSADYKKAVERMVRDGDLYKIEYEQTKQKVNIFLAKKDDPAYFEGGVSPMDHENRWRSYVTSYQTFEPTDGVPKEHLNVPMLERNMRNMGANPKSLSYPPSPPLQPTDVGAEGTSAANASGGDRAFNRLMAAHNEEKLDIRISVNNYKTVFHPGTQEGFSEPLHERGGDQGSIRDAEEDMQHREEVMKDSFLLNNKLMVGMKKEEVEKANEKFARLAGEPSEVRAEAAAGEEEEGEGERMEVDG